MNEQTHTSSAVTSRRSFVKASAVAGALVTSKSRAFAQGAPSNQINVALIGCGSQGEKQVESIIGKSKIEGINFVAVCDIWKYNRTAMYRRLCLCRRSLSSGSSAPAPLSVECATRVALTCSSGCGQEPQLGFL